MKKTLIVLIVLSILIISGLGGFLWVKNSFEARSSSENYQSFVIEKGAGASVIAASLEKQGIIKSALAFKLYTQVTGISKRIFAGEYRVSPHMNLAELTKVLTGGPLELWVTIPEGLRREEIAEKFINELGKSNVEASTFREEFLSASKDLEGYLFPDTYLFPKEVSGTAVVTRMKATFDRKIEEYKDEIENSNLSLDEIVTLASILERETRTRAERPVVAGILLNRIEVGMPLQADATAQYAHANVKCRGKTDCDWWPRPLLREDLTIDSPYNTYKISGLPPHAIANPGITALTAAIEPEDSSYFYYIHEEDGTVHYGKTLDEHNENVRRYLN